MRSHTSSVANIFIKSFIMALATILLLIGIGLCFILFLWFSMPGVSWLRDTNPTTTAMMSYQEECSRNRQEHYTLDYDFVPLDRISKNLQNAVIVKEDYGFFKHKGFQWEAIRSVASRSLKEGRIVGGGSTITQQLARNIFLKPTPSFVRKMREAVITIKLEKELSKQRILELYLNVAEWGPGIYGAEAAARTYYRKSASELSIEEAIRLSSILPNPRLYVPADRSSRRVRSKLAMTRRLYAIGFIDEKTCQELRQTFLKEKRRKKL